jgi:hypothetical protein
MQSSVNKYGLHNFICEIHEIVNDNDALNLVLIEKEQYWLDTLKPYDRQIGYNISPTAGRMLGVKHTEESRKRMSESHIGNRHTNKTKKKISEAQYKKVYQICKKTGEIIETFDSVLEASKKTRTQRTSISMCCRNVIKQSGGFHWSYDISKFVKPDLKIKKIDRPWKRKPITDGKTIWPSAVQARKDLGLTRGKIGGMIKRKEMFYV